MSGGDIKGGPWPRDVHESSKLCSGLPPPQWWTALATAPCSWQPPPSQVAQPSEAGSLSSGLLPTPSVVHTTCQLEEPLHMAGPAVTRRHMVSTILIGYGEHHFGGILRHDLKSILIETANMHKYVLVVIDWVPGHIWGHAQSPKRFMQLCRIWYILDLKKI